MAALFGADDHRAKRTSKRVDWARPCRPSSGRRGPPPPRGRPCPRLTGRAQDEGEVTRSLMQARCDRGAEIARLLGLRGDGRSDPRARRALGRPGQPHGLRGEEIPLRADPVPRADGGDLLGRRRRPGRLQRWPSGAAADGSIRRWSPRSTPSATTRASGPRCPRPRRAVGAGDRLLPADEAAWTDRLRVRRRHRRQVALDLPALRPHLHDRARPRGGARRRRRRAAATCAAPRSARRGQARDLQPDPRQARPAHPAEFAKSASIRDDRRILERVPGFARSPRWRPRTTSASTAAAIRTADRRAS